MDTIRSATSRSCGCCSALLLAAAIAIAVLAALAVRAVNAQAPGYDVVLVSDQSPSVWDCDGVGTDPKMLRVDAARLFVRYLGSDSAADHRLALLHFGGKVEQIAALSPLADPADRERLAAAAADVHPIPYTDPLLALEAAESELAAASAGATRRMIVLLSDGEPAWDASRRLSDAAYRAALSALADRFATDQIGLVVVLLAGQETSCGRRVEADWAAQWSDLAERTPGGALYRANAPDDLLPIYHAIARDLAGAKGDAAATTALLRPGQEVRLPIPLSPGQASLTVTIWKEKPGVNVALAGPDGRTVADGAQGVTVAGAGSREEIWRVALPDAGVWWLALEGEGRARIWQDAAPLPTPAPTETATPAPTATASPLPTATPSPSPTRTATASPSASPTASASPSPSPAATWTPAAVAAAPAPPAPRRPLAPLALAGVLAAAGGVALLRPRRGPGLTGALVPVAGPPDGLFVLPLDLARAGRAPVRIGRGGRGEWALPGWDGRILITAGRDGEAVATLAEGEALRNGVPWQGAASLLDGDRLACGEYSFCYENLLY
jgi:hypothetical protein